MLRRPFAVGLMMMPCIGGGLLSTSAQAQFSETDAAVGVRTALERGATAAVALLGRYDGFLGNPRVRIPLPGFLKDAEMLLRAIGQQKRLDDLVTTMNRAAEASMPEAQALLISAVKSMSVDDGRRILSGGDDSVTQFFAGKTREPLNVRLLPVVTKETDKLALVEKYNTVVGKAAALGLVRQQDANLQQYVTGRALDGLFLMIGEEERKIRRDPAGTGSAILRKVFGGLK